MTRQDMAMRYNHLEADYIAHVMKQLCSSYKALSVRCLSLKYVPRPLSKINPSLSLSNARAYITPNRLIHPMLIFRHRQPVGTYLHSPNTKILRQKPSWQGFIEELRSLPLGVARAVLWDENAHFAIKAILFAKNFGKRSLSWRKLFKFEFRKTTLPSSCVLRVLFFSFFISVLLYLEGLIFVFV
ncbi:hypothetical protein CEXT_786861 [Caerostris extrusa]|uniref:Reverse transcriptase RNase H-like domain-containing protein n=1 Tax=Caerostris extrusa TaxID=172846 RepID=A0AAV4VVL2_CAEEX|nr:hypothetical protein CEXT_786861 [Caerostris extrusa]